MFSNNVQTLFQAYLVLKSGQTYTNFSNPNFYYTSLVLSLFDISLFSLV
jgi:hypothetical protein